MVKKDRNDSHTLSFDLHRHTYYKYLKMKKKKKQLKIYFPWDKSGNIFCLFVYVIWAWATPLYLTLISSMACELLLLQMLLLLWQCSSWSLSVQDRTDTAGKPRNNQSYDLIQSNVSGCVSSCIFNCSENQTNTNHCLIVWEYFTFQTLKPASIHSSFC